MLLHRTDAASSRRATSTLAIYCTPTVDYGLVDRLLSQRDTDVSESSGRLIDTCKTWTQEHLIAITITVTIIICTSDVRTSRHQRRSHFPHLEASVS